MDYEKRYKEALAHAREIHRNEYEKRRDMEWLFPEIKENEKEKVKRILHSISNKMGAHLRYIFTEEEFQCFDAWSNAWLEKRDECKIDCPQNHQDHNYTTGGIVLEDFSGGEGFYKVHLDYLNKEQVEEVEELIKTWHKVLKAVNESPSEKRDRNI